MKLFKSCADICSFKGIIVASFLGLSFLGGTIFNARKNSIPYFNLYYIFVLDKNFFGSLLFVRE